ncbi:sod1, partial [Symbiodinium microadriaticum]
GKHGMHVHVFGDFSEGFVSGGGIFNPFGRNHGAPDDEERMVGDLGNIEADDDGIANVAIEDRQVKLIGPHSIIGRSIIVKSNHDDLGRGGNEFSLSTGNCGSRIAGGVVGIASS